MVKIKVKTFKHGESVGVVIPKEVREPLGVGVGDELLVDIDTIDDEKVIVFKKGERKGKGGKRG